jgi:predicted RNase H-like HicB family nuclease
MRYVYPACFYPEDDGRFSVEFADFELATFGDDIAEAMFMAQDAAAGRILALLKSGEALPKPSSPLFIQPASPEAFVSLVPIDLDSLAFHKQQWVK